MFKDALHESSHDVAFRRIRALDLEVYPRPRSQRKWLLPVCFASPVMRARLERLNPAHPVNWEESDVTGVPMMCYVLTPRQLRVWRGLPFRSVWPQLCDSLGRDVCRHFWPQKWIAANNAAAEARNRWESAHGGIRVRKMDYGPSVRTAAPMSIC